MSGKWFCIVSWEKNRCRESVFPQKELKTSVFKMWRRLSFYLGLMVDCFSLKLGRSWSMLLSVTGGWSNIVALFLAEVWVIDKPLVWWIHYISYFQTILVNCLHSVLLYLISGRLFIYVSIDVFGCNDIGINKWSQMNCIYIHPSSCVVPIWKCSNFTF